MQTLALHFLDPGQQRGVSIRRDANGRAAGDHRGDALRISNRGVQRDRAADGHTGERDLAVIDVTPAGMVVREKLGDLGEAELRARTGAPLTFAPDCKPLVVPAIALPD